MPYEDDYKMWLEEMLIESNPDWVCDGMYDLEFTHEWCGKHCGEDSNYVTPKCLHMYYHHIARADRKTEPSGYSLSPVEDEPLTCSFSDCDNFKNPDYARCIECKRKQIELKTEPNSSEIPTGSTTEDCSVVEERSSE